MTIKWSLYSKKYCVYSSLHIRLKNGMESLKNNREQKHAFITYPTWLNLRYITHVLDRSFKTF